ncbi:hypothetical protein MAQ5080_03258 [Marinomonas aquimarina]|uniref:Uncharacterized protein n=1 Tax=Marinomonas aquimarina TaxID=295068 RepID=A0A1A8TQL5_9GAMM|nr:hypothetical protein MAQ5080_03258 [Marinomonas aquimarina]
MQFNSLAHIFGRTSLRPSARIKRMEAFSSPVPMYDPTPLGEATSHPPLAIPMYDPAPSGEGDLATSETISINSGLSRTALCAGTFLHPHR